MLATNVITDLTVSLDFTVTPGFTVTSLLQILVTFLKKY
jgi:hypothetical protein